ncbi:family 16 glycosylhydrolase [Chloroflexota bacterium]
MKKLARIYLFLCSCGLSACSSFGLPRPTLTLSPTQTPVPTEIISPDSEWMLVWADEFDLPDGSQPDPEFWNYSIGTGTGGWGNNESQFYTDRIENALIEDGNLVIQALEEQYMGGKYTSARVNSMVKAEFTYGRFEARAKLPNTQGIWPAIWMMPALARYGTWPVSGEIDIMEMIGRDPALVHGTIHYGNPKGSQTDSYFLPTLDTFDQDFHIFAIEWEPDEIRWYVDGEMYHQATSWYTSYPDAPEGAPFDQPFYWILNVAVGGDWPGYPNESSKFPQRMTVDYVRVYQK